jgi:hypothetical protein
MNKIIRINGTIKYLFIFNNLDIYEKYRL